MPVLKKRSQLFLAGVWARLAGGRRAELPLSPARSLAAAARGAGPGPSLLLVAAGLLLPGELRPSRQLRGHAVPRRGAAAVARAGARAGGREVAARGLRGPHR